MPSAVHTLVQASVPGHLERWQELVEAQLEPRFYDHGPDFLVYVMVGAAQIAWVTVDADRDTVRLIRLSHLVGSTLLDEADATTLTLHVAAPISVLTARAPAEPGRTQLRRLHHHLLHHPHGGLARG